MTNKYKGMGDKRDRKTRYKPGSYTSFKMCVSKTAFATESEARAVGLKFGKRVYVCPKCTAWHLTSKGLP